MSRCRSRNRYSNGLCCRPASVSTTKPDQAAEWRLTFSDGKMSTVERDPDPSAALPAGHIGDRTSGSWARSTGLIQGRFGGAGHCSISLPAMMPIQPETLLVGTIKTRSVAVSHAELKPILTLFEARVLRRTSRSRPADARVDVWQGSGLR